jgi:hypothetical protein
MKERLFEGVLGEKNGVALLSTKLKLESKPCLKAIKFYR